MRFLIATALIVATVSSLEQEDTWDEAASLKPITSAEPAPFEELSEVDFETEPPPSDDAEEPGGDRACEFSKDQKKAQYVMNLVNRIRKTCDVAPATSFSFSNCQKRIDTGTEYHADVLVDSVKKHIVFQRLLPADQHPTDGNLRGLFHIVSISPHPCGADTATFTEVEVEYSTGLKPPAKINYQQMDISIDERAELPANWDWRDHIKGGHKAAAAQVISQGSCGSCWAFGGATTMAYRFNIASEGRYDIVPSPQIGMSCASKTTGRNPCNGGWMKWFYEAMSKYDIPAHWAQTYHGKKGQCSNQLGGSIAYKAGEAKINCKDNQSSRTCASWVKYYTCSHSGVRKECAKSCGCIAGHSIEYRGEADMMAEVKKNGPSAVLLKAVGKFMSYKTGVYSPAEGADGPINHALVLVGWGTQNGKKYWLIQNSWGAGWGDGGFIKLERGTNALSVETGGISSGFPDVENTPCSAKAVCENGGAYKSDCSCKCAAGYSGATCNSCSKTCNGAAFTGEAAITGGTCACKCKIGYYTPSNLKGWSDCGAMMSIGSSSGSGGDRGGNNPAPSPAPSSCKDSHRSCPAWKNAGYCTAHYVAYMGQNCKASCGKCDTLADVSSAVSVTASDVSIQFEVVGTQPGDKRQTVKKGDMFVAVKSGSKPWTAEGGWNTQKKAFVCGDKTWPAQPCTSSTAKISGLTSGRYNVYYVKYMGKNEFGVDKGWGSDFMKLDQTVSV